MTPLLVTAYILATLGVAFFGAVRAFIPLEHDDRRAGLRIMFTSPLWPIKLASGLPKWWREAFPAADDDRR